MTVLAKESRQVKRRKKLVNDKFVAKLPMTRGQKVIAFIEKYCKVPEGALVGKPVKLEKFQRDFILAVYDNPHGTRKAILSIARKNGKTALIACLVLAHLVGPEAKLNSQIASGAMSRENASLVFDAASKMIALDDTLRKIVRVTPSGKKLKGLPLNVEYKALSAEGKKNMGGSPILAILDETGQVVGSQDPFIDAVVTSQGAHESPLLLVISTQAASDKDLLSVWIDDALKGEDKQTICHLYAAEDGADVLDEKAWRDSNPALGIFRSLDDMKKMANDAHRMPSFENSFRNLYLNQRISVKSPFISRNSWLNCGAPTCALEDCIEIYGGLDLSSRADLTAFVLYGLAPDGKTWNVYPYFWTPEQGLIERAKRDRAPYDVWVKKGFISTTPSATVDYEFVAKEILELIDGLPVVAIAFDRWRIEYFMKEISRLEKSLPLVPFGQGFKDMSPALDDLEAKILNTQLAHGNHPVLTMCAANAVVTRDPADNRKLDKMKTSGRIDGIVALAMAAGIAAIKHEMEGDLDDFLSNPLVLKH